MLSKSKIALPKTNTFISLVPEEMRRKVLENVYCSNCCKAVCIVNYCDSEIGNSVLLEGNCSICGHKVARVLENN